MGSRFKLQPGDVFATSNPQGIGVPIRWAEKFWAKDKAATYGHTGIIQDSSGKTLEALFSIKESNINKYAGKKILIVRPVDVSKYLTLGAIVELKEEHLGQWYPAWRLPLFIVPPLARRISYRGRWVVCSELTAKFLHRIGIRGDHYSGTNPDELVDEWRHWRRYEIIFEGTL
jgi:hypothetical protein